MNEEKIKIIIKQLEHIKNEPFSLQNNKLFDDCKDYLMKDAPVGLKSKIFKLEYTYYSENFWDINTPSYPNETNIKKLIQLYEEELFELTNTTSKEDLFKKKLLKAKKMSPDFINKLGEMVVGDYPNFPRRTSWYITKFFEESGFPQIKHNGHTKRFWAAEQLDNMSLDDLYTIIKCLFKKKYFNDEDADINKAKKALAKELEDACTEDEFEDLSDVFKVDINSSLLFNKEINTDDDILNKDIEKARELYVKGEFQLAIEKIWDAFERIKSYYGKDKKDSANIITSTLSDEIKSAKNSLDTDENSLFFEKELRELTNLGNSYKIRHSEKNKPLINNYHTQEYLFFRVLNLINLIHSRMD